MAPRKPKNPLPYAYQVGKLPIIGPWYGRIGRIHQIAALPCAIEPQIVIQAAVVAAPRLIYSLFGPDCIDDAYDYLKGKPGRHRRQNFFKTRGVVGAPGSGLNGLATMLVPLGDLAQRLGWYMALVDGISEFVVNWTSLMYQYQGCRGLDTPFANATTAEGFNLCPGFGGHVVCSWNKVGAHIFDVGFTELVVPAGYNPGVGFSVSTGPNPIGPPHGTFSPRLIGPRDGIVWGEPTVQPKPGGVTTYTFYNFSSYGPTDGGVYRVAGQTQGGPVWVTGGSFFAYGAHPSDTKIGISPSKCDPVGQAFKHFEG